MAWAKDRHKNGPLLLISPANTKHLRWIRHDTEWVRVGERELHYSLTIVFLSLPSHRLHTHTLSLPHSYAPCFTLNILTVSELTAVEESDESTQSGTWCLVELSQKHRAHGRVEEVMVPGLGVFGRCRWAGIIWAGWAAACLEQSKLVRRGTGRSLKCRLLCESRGCDCPGFGVCEPSPWVMGNHGIFFFNAGLLRYNLYKNSHPPPRVFSLMSFDKCI